MSWLLSLRLVACLRCIHIGYSLMFLSELSTRYYYSQWIAFYVYNIFALIVRITFESVSCNLKALCSQFEFFHTVFCFRLFPSCYSHHDFVCTLPDHSRARPPRQVDPTRAIEGLPHDIYAFTVLLTFTLGFARSLLTTEPLFLCPDRNRTRITKVMSVIVAVVITIKIT